MTDRLDVVHEGRPVGVVSRVAGSPEAITFAYDPAWLARADAFPLSTRMPLQESAFAPTIVYPWFLNLLPEGDDLPLVGRNLGLSHIDVLALLARLGRDLAGAIEVAAETRSDHARPRYHRLDAAELAGAIRRLPERPLLAGEEGVRMSLAGNQSKLPVAKVRHGGLALPLDGAPSTHILKPAIRRFRGSVENEALCLALAAAAGLDAAHAETGVAEGEKYLLVRRYDRARAEAGGIARLHQEDFCQACGKPPYLKYEADRGHGRGPGIADCFAVLDAHATERARDRLALRDAVIFNLLIDNVDAHAKNFSLLLLPGGTVRLAPLYDLMCAGIYQGVTRNMAMRIAGQSRGDHVHRRHWDRLAATVGLSASSLRDRVAELAGALPDLARQTADGLRAEHLDRSVLDGVAGAVAARCARALANLAREPSPDG